MLKLRLKIFKPIYKVNPDPWIFGYTDWQDYAHLYYKGDEQVRLSFPAFVWFIFYDRTKSKRAKRDAANAKLKALLESFQRDIEIIRIENDRRIEEELKKQKEILARMEGSKL